VNEVGSTSRASGLPSRLRFSPKLQWGVHWSTSGQRKGLPDWMWTRAERPGNCSVYCSSTLVTCGARYPADWCVAVAPHAASSGSTRKPAVLVSSPLTGMVYSPIWQSERGTFDRDCVGKFLK
jgi:hypothetical protein